MEAEEGAGPGAGASKRRKSGPGKEPASQTRLSGLRAGGGRGGGCSPSGLEACPTSSAAECHLSGPTDEHYGCPFNQLNSGQLDTMAGALGGCGGAEGPERVASFHGRLRGGFQATGVGSLILGDALRCLRARMKQRHTGKSVLGWETHPLKAF